VSLPIDRYAVNDALTILAGGRLSDDDLNELTHTVADVIDRGGFEAPHAFADRVRSLLNAEGIDRL
jgi:hypothetical protein